MIDAKDLRHHNWVTDIKRDRFVKICGAEPSGNDAWVNYLNGYGVYKISYEDVTPIPLTPELMEKCGFLVDSETNRTCRVHLNPDMILWYKSNYLAADIEGDYWHTTYWKSAIIIKYLHQLQNLYYSLFGQELEITL